VELPLAATGAGVVARRGLRVHSELSHQARLRTLVVEVAAEAELRELELPVTEDLARARDRVVLGRAEIVVVYRVDPQLADKDLARQRSIRSTGVARRPREIRKAKRRLFGACELGSSSFLGRGWARQREEGDEDWRANHSALRSN